MKKQRFTKITTILLTICMIIAMLAPITAEAAMKYPKITKDTMKIWINGQYFIVYANSDGTGDYGLHIGAKKTIKVADAAKVKGTIKWSTSNKKVVSVSPSKDKSSAVIKAKKAGKATITASLVDGIYTNGKFTWNVVVEKTNHAWEYVEVKTNHLFYYDHQECTICGKTKTNDECKYGKESILAAEKWFDENIADDMSDLDKVKKIMSFFETWTYDADFRGPQKCNVALRGDCVDGNQWFVIYCGALGLSADMEKAPEEVLELPGTGNNHHISYVKIDGDIWVCDATPECCAIAKTMKDFIKGDWVPTSDTSEN